MVKVCPKLWWCFFTRKDSATVNRRYIEMGFSEENKVDQTLQNLIYQFLVIYRKEKSNSDLFMVWLLGIILCDDSYGTHVCCVVFADLFYAITDC